MKKVIIGNIFLLLPIFTIPLFILKWIKAKYTKFSLGTKSIDYKYEFLNTKYNSFSVDRVTEVIIKESLLDKWLGTCSIVFYSIGSNMPMIFEDITKTPELDDQILSKVGIYKSKESSKVAISFEFGEFFKSNIFLNSFLTLCFGIIIIPYLYSKFYYSTRFYSNKIYKNFIEAGSGIIFQQKSYILFDNIKAIRAKKYPLTNSGSLIFDISGDRRIQYGNKKNQFRIASNGLKIDFVKNVFVGLDLFEKIFTGNDVDTKIDYEIKQNLGNTILPLFGLGFITIGIGWILIPIVIWYIKTKRFILEGTRLVTYFGIIYKSKKTIIYKKVDFIEQNQTILNKMFGNGTIAIFTKGGSNGSDMIFSDITEFREVYDKIKEKIK